MFKWFRSFINLIERLESYRSAGELLKEADRVMHEAEALPTGLQRDAKIRLALNMSERAFNLID